MSNTDYIKSLESRKKLLNRLKNCSDSAYILNNIKLICRSCKHYDGIDICERHQVPAFTIRRSPVSCMYYNKNTKTKKKIKLNLYKLLKSIIDSLKLNNFYPLEATLRGESYELKKKIQENTPRNSSKTRNQKK